MNWIYAKDEVTPATGELEPGLREFMIKWPIGVDIKICDFCHGPLSYRDGMAFCRCRTKIGETEK